MEKNNQKSQVFASSNRLESNPQKNPSKIDTTITTEELSMAFKTEFSQHQFINPKTTALGELQKSERTNLLAKSEFDRKLDLKKITENPGGQMFRKAGKASESKRISKRENELEELGNIINSETHKQCSLGRKGAQGEEKEVRETHSEKRLYEVTEEKGENSLKKGKLLPINGTTPIPTIQEPQIEEEAKKLIQTISQYSPHTKSPIRTQFSSIERTHPQRQKNDSSEIIIEGSERSLEEEAIFERKLQIMKNEGAERFELELSGSVVEVPSIAIEIDKERKVVLETNVEEVNRKRLHKRTTRDNDPFSQNQNVSKKKKLELDLDFNLSSHICRNRQEPQLFKSEEMEERKECESSSIQHTLQEKEKDLSDGSQLEESKSLLNSKFEKEERPKRNIIKKNYSELDDRPSLQMIECIKYKKMEDRVQPFELYISLECLMLMNIHSHLTQNEIIGFVGGQIIKDTEAKRTRLFIQRAYPCESIENAEEDLTINVEMDPESEARIKDQVEQNNQKILGWYHSHATFDVHPSDVDVKNQHNFQNLFQIDGIEFFGIIIGPYNNKVKEDCVSDMKYFHVNKMIPFELSATFLPQKILPHAFFNEVMNLCKKYAKKKSKIKFNDRWKKMNYVSNYHKLLYCLKALLLHNKLYFEEDTFKRKLYFIGLLGKSIDRMTIEEQFKRCLNDPNWTMTALCNQGKTIEIPVDLYKSFVHNTEGLENCLNIINTIFDDNWTDQLNQIPTQNKE